MLHFIRRDLEQADRKDRAFYRYFTITHLYNAGLPDDALQSYRSGLAKLVNNLSWEQEIVVPAAIDPRHTIFRIDLRDLQWDDKVWERILREYPYGILHDADAARFFHEAMGCRLPHVRADWFVFAASRPPLYHEILRLPATAGQLENLLRVDVAKNIRELRAVRAGINESGVSNNNRLLERHKSIHGAYWRSYDFAAPKGGDDDRKNLFQHPLGPEPAKNAFRPDGGEIIFSLPNGLHGYMLVNGKGERINRGPPDIVRDPKQRDGGAVINGISCMSCHTRGLIFKADKIRNHVKENYAAFERDEADTVFRLYPPPEKFRQLLEGDNKLFAKAVLATGAQFGTTDPIVALASRYEWELDVDLAAAEAGLQRKEFLKRLGLSKLRSRDLGVLRTGGTVQRQVWEANFASLAGELGLDIFRPAPDVEPVPAKPKDDILVNSIGMKLKRIPDRAFRMGVYEVTQAEYQKVMGVNPSHFRGPDTVRHPVECVSWKDAVKFCEKLSASEGRVYRLPTEAEWEHACRADSRTAYSFGDDAAKLGEHAWFKGNAENKTHNVGTRTANPWGLHDMHGNVREWCADYFDKNYDPNSPLAASVAAFRVLRGGSYNEDADACRSTTRRSSLENLGTGTEFGFRVVLDLDE
jgi:hypothetical protein